MGDLKTSRWTRYGKDRIYVSTADGVRVGWLDLIDGSVTIEKPELTAEFHAVLATVAPDAFNVPDLPRQTQPVLGPAPVAAAWTDLALNKPGEGARAKADEELAAMKDQSKVFTFLARAIDAKTDERAWRVGAVGEEAIGRKLEKLRERGCHVLHSIPVSESGTDIDHLVIGTGGVYCINTKRHPDKQIVVTRDAVRVAGRNYHYIEKSESEGKKVKRILRSAVGFDVPVRPVIVCLTFTAITLFDVKSQPENVAVLPREQVPGWWKKMPERISRDQIDAVYDMARRSTTWLK